MGTHKGCPYGRGEGGRTGGAVATWAGTRPAPTGGVRGAGWGGRGCDAGRHKACPYRRVEGGKDRVARMEVGAGCPCEGRGGAVATAPTRGAPTGGLRGEGWGGAVATWAGTRGAPTGGLRGEGWGGAVATWAGTRPAPTGGLRGEGRGGAVGERAGTRPAPTGWVRGEGRGGAVEGDSGLGTHKGCPYGDLRGREGPGWGTLCRLGTCYEYRDRVGEGCCRRGGVAGAEPPHKGGPNRPDRPELQQLVVSG